MKAIVAAALGAFFVFGAVGPASAAPISAGDLKSTLTRDAAVEKTHWTGWRHCHRRCHWRHGHRHCWRVCHGGRHWHGRRWHRHRWH